MTTLLIKRLPLAIGAALCLVASTSFQPAQAAAIRRVVNFDDLRVSDQGNRGIDVAIPDGYGGIIWRDQWNYFATDPAAPALPYIPSSGTQSVYTRAAKAAFFFKEAVTFEGAFFAGYDISTPHFELYLRGQSVAIGQSRSQISATPLFIASGYAGLVDEVRVVQNYELFSAYVMDDVIYTINTSSSSPVDSIPSPALLPGLLGFGMAMWRRRSQPAEH